MSTFSKRLKKLQKESGFNQKQFAEKMGTTPKTLRKYLNAENLPTVALIIKIAKTFEVSTDWLLGVKEPQKSETEKTVTAEVVKAQGKLNALRREFSNAKVECVCEYTGLSKEAVKALHKSRYLKFCWKREEEE